jgi:hypothetical protein
MAVAGTPTSADAGGNGSSETSQFAPPSIDEYWR